MADSKVSRRYAAALIELAKGADAVDPVAADLKRFVGLLHGELERALCTPLFPADERTNVLNALLPRLELHPLAADFLRLLDEKGRFPQVRSIVGAFDELADEAAGRVRVEVATAEPMSPQIEAELRSILERSLGKQVVLTPKVDPQLIGGMVASIGSKVYDSSIRTRLEQIKLSLINAQMPAQA
jgi:F-type H+-transporting ATPase subunit delta